MNLQAEQPVSVDGLGVSMAGSANRRLRWVIVGMLVVAVVLLGYGLHALVGGTSNLKAPLVYYTVKRADLPIIVTERGNLESQITEEITCEVEDFGDRYGSSGTQILFIVPNGTSVKKGDLLVELDSAPLKDRIDIQYLKLQNAEAEKIQQISKYENQIAQNETDLAEAELSYKLAKMDREMYDSESGGTYQIELQDVEMEIQKARAEQLINDTNYNAVLTLYRLGYKSKGNVAQTRLQRIQSVSKLVSQLANLTQLAQYTHEMQKLSLEAKYQTAIRNKEQVKLNNEAELAQAKAAKESAEKEYDKEKERYDRYQSQLEKCKIFAPQDGMVAYAMTQNRGGQSTVIEEGALVRQRQKILTLPNLSKMQVTTSIHESVLDQVKVGQPALIRVDAFSDKAFKGTVKSVAVLPDPGSWFSSDTKVYKTVVTIDEEVAQLKPGMTAIVEIHVERLKNTISVPIQAIVQRASNNWCFVRDGRGVARRAVKLGKTNDKFVQIVQGIKEGDAVVLNPAVLLENEKDESAPDAAKDGKSDAHAKTAGDGASGLPNGTPGTGPGAGKRPGPGAGKRAGGQNLKALDKNKDGKLSKEELPEAMRRFFDTLDSNHDGVLDAAEQTAAQRAATKRAAAKRGKKKRPGAGGAPSGTPAGRPGT